jgi:hypothetical protein
MEANIIAHAWLTPANDYNGLDCFDPLATSTLK